MRASIKPMPQPYTNKNIFCPLFGFIFLPTTKALTNQNIFESTKRSQ